MTTISSRLLNLVGTRASGRLASHASRRLAPMIEVIEERALLSSCVPAPGNGFLSGCVTADGAKPLANVTIELYRAGSNCPLAQQKTDAAGRYLFDGLQPGDYLIKEVTPAGYTAVGVDIDSQLAPATAQGNDAIKVTVVDHTKVFVNYNGVVGPSTVNLNVSVNGKATTNATGPLNISLGAAAGSTSLNPGFVTVCVDDTQSLSYEGGESFRVVPRPITALTNGSSTIAAERAGRIAYLFNHYGNSSLTNIQGAGLQLAIWELIHDSGNADFATGNFQVTGPFPGTTQETADQAIDQATAYFDESAGKSERAIFLDAGAANPGQTTGLQSMLARMDLCFTLETKPTAPCAVENVRYVINGCRTVTSLGGNVKAGDSVEVRFRVPDGVQQTYSLVSYTTPSRPSDPRFLTSQSVFCYDTKTLGPGRHSLKVTVPRSNFQIDFVCGTVIERFDPSRGITYHAQNRFIDGAVGTASRPSRGGCDTIWTVIDCRDKDDRDRDGRRDRDDRRDGCGIEWTRTRCDTRDWTWRDDTKRDVCWTDTRDTRCR